MRLFLPAIVAVSAVVGGAGASAWPAARGMTAGAGDASGIGAVRSAGSWGRAIGVPGLAALGRGNAEVYSVSCGSAGNCAAGRDYAVRGSRQGFVASQKNGRWGRAVGVPGLAALNKGGHAHVSSVSCGSAGSCAAGGDYQDRRGFSQGFVAAGRSGAWDKAIEVPGLGALNTDLNAFVSSVSCAPAGSCAAGGGYRDRRGFQGFVAVGRDGRWGKAIAVPGLAALNNGDAAVLSVSCAPAGTCAAGGDYSDRSGNNQGFVVSQSR